MEKEKENKNEYEMPVPEDVEGMHILLVDPDISSLMHTTSMLEDATYKGCISHLSHVPFYFFGFYFLLLFFGVIKITGWRNT